MDERPLYREVLAINRAIASAEGYDEVLRLVVEKTAAFTGATACMLVLAQQDGLARIVRSVGIDPVAAAGLAIPLTGGIDRELCRLLGCQSPDQFVGVPVTGKEGLLGILGIYWQGARALEGASEDELLSALADQAAIALDNIERGHRLRASAQALQTSKERFRNLVETTSDWLWEIDENGVYTYVSPQVRQLLGYEPEERAGANALRSDAARGGGAGGGGLRCHRRPAQSYLVAREHQSAPGRAPGGPGDERHPAVR